MIGKRIAHYDVTAQLGAGGMGEVYLARDTTLGREVALKLLPAELSTDATARARLLNEARTASSLNHPHICTIFEVGEAEGRAYIAMEHVEGEPLAAKVPEGGLPAEAVVRYGAQVADALAHAHDRGIIHRDLKTSNVMITPEGRVKVLDFGLAKRLRDQDLAEVTRSGKALTQAGAVVGTLHALAPEVLSGTAADARSDVWALGVLLYEMAAGVLPFQGKTGFEMTSKILRESPWPLPERVPAGLRAIVQNCLVKEPGQRYQRVGEVRAALEAIRSDSTVAVTQIVQKESRAAWRWILPSATVVVFAVVLAGIILKRGEPGPQAPSDTGPRLSTGGKASKIPEANEYFERGFLIAMSRLDIPEVRKMYERALELDPHFADARAEYGFLHAALVLNGYSNDASSFYKAEEEIRRAMKDDPESPRAHSALATIYMYVGRKELTPGEAERALKASPNEMGALTALIGYHLINGEFTQAQEDYAKAIATNSLFMPVHVLYSEVLLDTGNSAGAVTEASKAVEQGPGIPMAVRALARAYLCAGDLTNARRTLERALPASRQNYLMRTSWALLLASEGKRKEAQREMDVELQKYSAITWRVALDVAEFRALLGETDKALDWLDRAVRLGDERLEWFQRDPLLANIREHPRFKQILESIAYRREQPKKK